MKRSCRYCPGNSLGNGGKGAEFVMLAQQARSSGGSADVPASFMPATVPSFIIANSILTVPLLLMGGKTVGGRRECQFLVTIGTIPLRYGSKFTPIVSLKTCTPPCAPAPAVGSWGFEMAVVPADAPEACASCNSFIFF